MSAAVLHNQRFVRADFVEIRLCNVFIIFNPALSHVKFAIWIVDDKFLDYFTVFIIVGRENLCKIRLTDCVIDCKVSVTVRFEESRINEVIAVVQNLRGRISEFFRLFCIADIGKNAIFDQCRLCKGLFFVHSDYIAENKRLFHNNRLQFIFYV